ncbi:MAG: sugar phosphate nucleotidyltransferase, partial [Verrucomicrobiota bacterium]
TEALRALRQDGFLEAGEALLHYAIHDAARSGFNKVVVITSAEIEEPMREAVDARFASSLEVVYVIQNLGELPTGYSLSSGRGKPWGTGQAVWVTRNHIDEPFAVINADDFYARSSYEVMAGFLQRCEPNLHSLAGFKIRNTLSPYGTVSRAVCRMNEHRMLTSIRELKKIEDTDGDLFNTDDDGNRQDLTGHELVSMNMWGFHPSIFDDLEREFRSFLDQHMHDEKGEFFIPTLIGRLLEQKQARVEVLPTEAQWFGVTYSDDKPDVIAKIRGLVDAGEYPERIR